MPLIIGQKGSSRCCCGDCRGFPAFDGSHRFFKCATFYDLDCCAFGSCVDANGQDGYIKFQSTGCGYGIVVESTGNYGHYNQNGDCVDCKTTYTIDTIHDLVALMFNTYVRCGNFFATAPNVVHPTKVTARKASDCCNEDGNKIYWELSEEITNSTCDEMGACCGWKDYGYDSGNADDKKTCRMCHECECDTERGEVWNGNGSSCNTSPCSCQGFRAFDGSDQYYQFARLIDEDTCPKNNAQAGSLIVQWTGSQPCNCGVTQFNTFLRSNSGIVTVSTGPYARDYPVGACYNIPSAYITESPYNSATFCSYGASEFCDNPGDKLGWMLYGPVACHLNPLP
jgi:hypothetical protein